MQRSALLLSVRFLLALPPPRAWVAALIALCALCASGPLRAQERPDAPDTTPKAALGERLPELAFRDFLTNADGRRLLSEFRGQPVLIVNWTDTDFGLGAATQARKLAAELVPDGLVCILMDSHNKQEEAILTSAMRHFPGSLSRCMRTMNLPIAYLENGPPPRIALIGVDGTLLLAGSYTLDLSKAEKLIKAELKQLKTGWGEHPAARSGRALAFGEQRLAQAHDEIAAALAAEPGAAELVEARDEVATRVLCWERTVQTWLEDGRWVQAQAEAQAFAAAVAGHEEWTAKAVLLLTGFEGPEAAKELELDKKLLALLEPLNKRKPSEGDAAKLRKFAESAGETRVGARAQRLAQIAALAAG